MSDWRFTIAELAALETDQEAHMMDTCTIGVYHAVPDGYGIPTPTYQASDSSVICGLNENVRQEVQSRGEVVMVDAVLRLPVGTAVDSRDRITITHRFGSELTVKPVYNIIGNPRRGASGLLLNLALVTED